MTPSKFLLDAMKKGIEAGNRLQVNEPKLVMPSISSPTSQPKPKPKHKPKSGPARKR